MDFPGGHGAGCSTLDSFVKPFLEVRMCTKLLSQAPPTTSFNLPLSIRSKNLVAASGRPWPLPNTMPTTFSSTIAHIFSNSQRSVHFVPEELPVAWWLIDDVTTVIDSNTMDLDVLSTSFKVEDRHVAGPESGFPVPNIHANSVNQMVAVCFDQNTPA